MIDYAFVCSVEYRGADPMWVGDGMELVDDAADAHHFDSAALLADCVFRDHQDQPNFVGFRVRRLMI